VQPVHVFSVESADGRTECARESSCVPSRSPVLSLSPSLSPQTALGISGLESVPEQSILLSEQGVAPMQDNDSQSSVQIVTTSQSASLQPTATFESPQPHAAAPLIAPPRRPRIPKRTDSSERPHHPELFTVTANSTTSLSTGDASHTTRFVSTATLNVFTKALGGQPSATPLSSNHSPYRMIDASTQPKSAPHRRKTHLDAPAWFKAPCSSSGSGGSGDETRLSEKSVKPTENSIFAGPSASDYSVVVRSQDRLLPAAESILTPPTCGVGCLDTLSSKSDVSVFSADCIQQSSFQSATDFVSTGLPVTTEAAAVTPLSTSLIPQAIGPQTVASSPPNGDLVVKQGKRGRKRVKTAESSSWNAGTHAFTQKRKKPGRQAMLLPLSVPTAETDPPTDHNDEVCGRFMLLVG